MEHLVRRHHDRVWLWAQRLARWRLHSPDQAADIFQLTWEKALPQLGSFRDEAKFSTWLFPICRGACADLGRSRRRAPEADSIHLLDQRPAPSADVDCRLDLRRALNALPEDEREAVEAVYLFGFSCTEAAAIADVARTTMSSRVQRGLKRLGRSGLLDGPAREGGSG
jgi:RNA polymerase sigma-70 factor (ECF subfamily)